MEALASADGDPFLGLTIAGRFVVVGRLGAGSMGTVYRARQEAVGRDVALKILRTDRAFDAMAKARFGREARALSLLSSPHTVTVFDFGEIPDPHADELAPAESSLFLAMELLEGESLGTRLKRRGRLPAADATTIARQVLLSLAEAHDKGIIHRDLKPDNIFLTRGALPTPAASASSPNGSSTSPSPSVPPAPPAPEIAKVLDFGIAKVNVEARGVDALETQAGTVFGTPRYMSPEQAQGKDLDPRSDLYTLGVLLYQMLVGRAPFTDDDAVVVMARHIKSTAVPPIEAAPDAGIAPTLSALVMRALSKDPKDRPRTAHVFLAELDAATRAASPEPRAGSVTGSGEVAAVVHDGLGAAPTTWRERARMTRARAALLVVTSGAVVASAGLFALAAMGDKQVPITRSGIGHVVASRRLAILQAESASSAAPAAAPPAAAPPAAEPALPAPPAGAPLPSASNVRADPQAPIPGGRRGRRYKKFDP
jgi:serine/threonine-protein kinase